MKKAIIAILVCVNVALLLALMLGKSVPEARAYPGSVMPNNTIMITGHIREDDDALYVLDLATKRLAAWEFDITKKQLRPLGVRRLSTDIPTRKP